MSRISLRLNAPESGKAQTNSFYGVRTVMVVTPTPKHGFYPGTQVEIRIPGRKVAAGYDRLNHGNQYEYIPAHTLLLLVDESYTDRGYDFIAGEVQAA